jgi:hypothetical protein
MAIPSRQIGWGTEENLLAQISKQLEYLTKVVYNIPNNTTTTSTTTSTTTTAVPLFTYLANYSTDSGPAACYQAQDQFNIYSATPIGDGVAMFTDEALTTPVADAWYSVSGTYYGTTSGIITSSASCPATSAFSYVISQTDLDAATGNADTALNGKVFALTADDGSGNPSSRTFTSSGSYNHWLCSADPITPTFGYYAADVFITAGLVSTQTNIGPC